MTTNRMCPFCYQPRETNPLFSGDEGLPDIRVCASCRKTINTVKGFLSTQGIAFVDLSSGEIAVAQTVETLSDARGLTDRATSAYERANP